MFKTLRGKRQPEKNTRFHPDNPTVTFFLLLETLFDKQETYPWTPAQRRFL
jgi:hypothetical protein